MSKLKAEDKPFEISKWLVWDAYKKVKANKGAPGVDGQAIEQFEQDLENNLYRLWSASRRTGGEAMSLDS
jgi:retron-type reverse transcriptase